MRKIFLSALKMIAPVLLFATAMQASAALVTSIHSGKGSGTLGDVSFEDAYFAIYATADTSTITSCGADCLSNINISALIIIDSPDIVAASFITPTSYVSSNNGVAFARADGTSLFDGPSGAWDMASTVGPLIDTGELLQWISGEILTTGGVLVFDEGTTPATFAATVAGVCEVPLPAGAWLFGSGLIGLVGVARRKA
ncbi:MAG: VPLPA-CTERM sorting domain-containing protein [Spongiibacteraceae bacterium]